MRRRCPARRSSTSCGRVAKPGRATRLVHGGGQTKRLGAVGFERLTRGAGRAPPARRLGRPRGAAGRPSTDVKSSGRSAELRRGARLRAGPCVKGVGRLQEKTRHLDTQTVRHRKRQRLAGQDTVVAWQEAERAVRQAIRGMPRDRPIGRIPDGSVAPIDVCRHRCAAGADGAQRRQPQVAHRVRDGGRQASKPDDEDRHPAHMEMGGEARTHRKILSRHTVDPGGSRCRARARTPALLISQAVAATHPDSGSFPANVAVTTVFERVACRH